MTPSMKIFKFKYEDHAESVKKWPEKRLFPLPPQDMLSDIGFIAGDAACGFLYTTNSKIGWIEWVFSNPEKTKEERTEAIAIVFKLLEMTARNLGVKALFSASGFVAYGDILECQGFKETDVNMTHFVKVLEDL